MFKHCQLLEWKYTNFEEKKTVQIYFQILKCTNGGPVVNHPLSLQGTCLPFTVRETKIPHASSTAKDTPSRNKSKSLPPLTDKQETERALKQAAIILSSQNYWIKQIEQSPGIGFLACLNSNEVIWIYELLILFILVPQELLSACSKSVYVQHIPFVTQDFLYDFLIFLPLLRSLLIYSPLFSRCSLQDHIDCTLLYYLFHLPVPPSHCSVISMEESTGNGVWCQPKVDPSQFFPKCSLNLSHCYSLK